MEMQAEMFNRMCSVRSSEMNIDTIESKDENDDQSQSLELFDSELWKDPILNSSKTDYAVDIFDNTYDKSDDISSKDSNL